MLTKKLAARLLLSAFACLTLFDVALTQDSGSAAFPFEEGESPRAILTLGGQTMRLVVDTGCTLSTLDGRFRKVLGEQLEQVDAASNIATSEVIRYACKGGSVGKLPLDLPSVICLDFGELLAGEGVDGCLGMDFLRRYCVDFDPEAGTVRLTPRMPPDLPDDRVELPLAYSRTQAPVLVGLAGETVLLSINVDTGSTRALVLSSADERRVFPDGLGRSVPSHFGTIHGDGHSATTRMPRLDLGEFTATNVLCEVGNAARKYQRRDRPVVPVPRGLRFPSRQRDLCAA